MPGHTKDFLNGSDPCLHGTYDEVGTTKHYLLARCQYNVTGWVSMWASDMLACDMLACDMLACDMLACDMLACDMLACDMLSQ